MNFIGGIVLLAASIIMLFLGRARQGEERAIFRRYWIVGQIVCAYHHGRRIGGAGNDHYQLAPLAAVRKFPGERSGCPARDRCPSA
jgi:hypothetical protein